MENLNYHSVNINIDDLHCDLIYNSNFSFFLKNDITETNYNLHTHHYFELFFVTKGALNVFVADKQITLGENDMICIKPGEVHYIAPMRSDVGIVETERLSLAFTFHASQNGAEPLSSLSKIFADTMPYILIPKNSSIGAVFEKMADYYSDETILEDDKKFLFAGSFCELLLMIKRFASNNAAKNSHLISCNTTDFPQYAINLYVARHYNEDISLADLQEITFLSKKQIITIIKQMTGMTFRQYVIYLRMKYAAKLLLDGELSIADIALKVGYTSPNGFYTAFRKTYNTTPEKYQRAVRANKID